MEEVVECMSCFWRVDDELQEEHIGEFIFQLGDSYDESSSESSNNESNSDVE